METNKNLKLYKCPNCNIKHWIRSQIFLSLDEGKIVCTECQFKEINTETDKK